MQNQMDRMLTILADGEPVTGYARARPIGTEKAWAPCSACETRTSQGRLIRRRGI